MLSQALSGVNASALTCYVNSTTGAGLAGQTNPPAVNGTASPSDVMLLIKYSDGGYQIVDLVSGLALASPNSTTTQLQFAPPDSNPAGGTNVQFWTISGLT